MNGITATMIKTKIRRSRVRDKQGYYLAFLDGLKVSEGTSKCVSEDLFLNENDIIKKSLYGTKRLTSHVIIRLGDCRNIYTYDDGVRKAVGTIEHLSEVLGLPVSTLKNKRKMQLRYVAVEITEWAKNELDEKGYDGNSSIARW